MNAIAPPPKRPHGTGTISYHTPTGTWRCRTPGQGGQSFSGFMSREAAQNALDDAMRGLPARRRQRRQAPLIVLRATLRYALELATRLEIDFDAEVTLVRRGRVKRSGTI